MVQRGVKTGDTTAVLAIKVAQETAPSNSVVAAWTWTVAAANSTDIAARGAQPPDSNAAGSRPRPDLLKTP